MKKTKKPKSLPELYDRFHYLGEALNYSNGKSYFSVEERMLIHQERSSILATLDRMRYNGKREGAVNYSIPNGLEQNIKTLQYLIEADTSYYYETDVFKHPQTIERTERQLLTA